jgi:TetR/AcrR family transcriptional repressor of nem operon
MARTKTFDPDVAVAAAMHLFWRNGYAATTPQQLVDELGIGRGSLYNAFGSKRGIFERALRYYYEHETMRLIAVLEGLEPPRERLRTALSLVIEAAKVDHRGCLVANTAVELAADEEVATLVRRVFDRQESAFRAVIEEGQRSGDFSPDHDAGAAAALLLAAINGIRVLAKADPDSPRLAGLAEAALRIL